MNLKEINHNDNMRHNITKYFSDILFFIQLISVFFLLFIIYSDVNTITPIIAVLMGVVGSLVFTAIAIMIVAKVKSYDQSKGMCVKKLALKSIANAINSEVSSELEYYAGFK